MDLRGNWDAIPISIQYPLATWTDHRNSFGDFEFIIFLVRAKPNSSVALKTPSFISARNDFAGKQNYKLLVMVSRIVR